MRSLAIGSAVAGRWPGQFVRAGVIFLACLIVPALVYAVAVWHALGTLWLSAYVPYEDLHGALRTVNPALLLSAPLVSVNFSSTHTISALYVVSVGQVAFAVLLPLLLALVAPDGSCAKPAAAQRWHTVAVAGPLAAAGGIGTTLMGCCGGGLPGAAIALLGIGSAAAADVARFAVVVQIGLIAALAIVALTRRRRTRLREDGLIEI